MVRTLEWGKLTLFVKSIKLVTLSTAPEEPVDQLPPHVTIHPNISSLADKLICPPAPRPNSSKRSWEDSDSE